MAKRKKQANNLNPPGVNYNSPQKKIFFKDKNLFYVWCNEHYAKDLMIKPQDIAGKTDYDFFPKELAEKYRLDDKKIMRKGLTEDIEENYVKGGKKFWVHTIKTPVKDAEGSTAGILGVFCDTTEQRLLESMLKESEEKYREIFSSANDMIIYVDGRGKIIDVNEKIEEVLGYTREEVVGKHFAKLDILTLKDAKKILKIFADTIRKGELFSGVLANVMELDLKRKDGKTITAEFNTRLIKKEGKIDCVLTVARDVTQRKKYEEGIKQRVNELKELDQAKTKFISMAGHELRNPLQSLMLANDVLLSEPGLSERQKKYLNLIEYDAHRLKTLINNLLDLSAIQLGKFELHKERINAGEMIEEVSLEMRLKAEKKHINLTVLYPASTVTFLADKARLSQVLVNLIDNAIKFTPENGFVELSLVNKRGKLVFCVKDSGVGIPQESQGMIFKKFFQSEPKSSRMEGFGLGLVISHEIVEAHGGKMWFQSREGAGSKFCFTIPSRR